MGHWKCDYSWEDSLGQEEATSVSSTWGRRLVSPIRLTLSYFYGLRGWRFYWRGSLHWLCLSGQTNLSTKSQEVKKGLGHHRLSSGLARAHTMQFLTSTLHEKFERGRGAAQLSCKFAVKNIEKRLDKKRKERKSYLRRELEEDQLSQHSYHSGHKSRGYAQFLLTLSPARDWQALAHQFRANDSVPFLNFKKGWIENKKEEKLKRGKGEKPVWWENSQPLVLGPGGRATPHTATCARPTSFRPLIPRQQPHPLVWILDWFG